jgi:thiazole tautomerase (transcriptional regulator TenI)
MLTRIAVELAQAQRASESWLVVNDRVDIALVSGARAVQLTSRSVEVGDARSLAPDLLVGASVHNVKDAIAAERAGASWLVAGSVHATATHPGEAGRGVEFVAEITWRVRVPVIAIGGVLPQHIRPLREAGAHGVAAIRGIWGETDAARAAADYLSMYDSDGDA